MLRGASVLILALSWAGLVTPLTAAEKLNREEQDMIAQRSFHPGEITLKKRISFERPTPGGGTAQFSLPPGKQVQVVGASPAGVTLQKLGATATVPFAATNFFALTQQQRDRSHAQRMEKAGKLRDNITQPHVQATLFQLRSGGPGMTRSHVELALDAFPWSPDRLATHHAAQEFLAFIGLSGILVQANEEELILVTSQNAQRQQLEVHWNSSLPRDQFFVRSPQALDPQLAKGFSYEIPRERPLLRAPAGLGPQAATSGEIKSIIPEDGQPVPLPEETSEPLATTTTPDLAAELLRLKNETDQAQPPQALPSGEWDEMLQRFNRGELDLEETRRLLTRYEPFGDELSRDELDDLIEWLQPENKHVRDDDEGITATLYFEKPYVFITARPEQNAYEFIVYPQGFWESQPMRFLYQRAWFNLPEP